MGLRVLHLGKYYPPHRGGIETVLEAACTGAGAFIEPRALVLNTTRRTVRENVDGIPVTRVARLATVGAVALTPSLAWWLGRAEADVVVLHEPNPMALVAYALARPAAHGGKAPGSSPYGITTTLSWYAASAGTSRIGGAATMIRAARLSTQFSSGS